MEVQRINQVGARLGRIVRPGSQMIDYIPWLRFVPGYLNQVRQWHREELQLFTSQLEGVKIKLVRAAIFKFYHRSNLKVVRRATKTLSLPSAFTSWKSRQTMVSAMKKLLTSLEHFSMLVAKQVHQLFLSRSWRLLCFPRPKHWYKKS